MTDGNVSSMILTIAIQVTISISKNPNKDAFVFTVTFQSVPKFLEISKKKFSLKFFLYISRCWPTNVLKKFFIVDILLRINFNFYRNY